MKKNPYKSMVEELPRNENVILKKQSEQVHLHLGKPDNRQRCHVGALSVILWLLLPLAALSLWMLRLLGIVTL